MPKKSLGQCFMLDERVLDREVKHAQVEGKRVLEVGAGIGNLTSKLAEKAKHVTAVEKDERLIPVLEKNLGEFDNVEIVCEDILDYEIKNIERIVSNVPYVISSPLVFKLTDVDFELAILCLQKEFARRMAAQPDSIDYSRLSVMTQLFFKPRIIEYVPKNAFYPQPEVESAVVKLKKLKTQKPDAFLTKVVLALFQHKNKTVRNALVDSAHVFKVEKKKMRDAA
ncbi:MAG: 16S rRNA (adenine(1518)-N(6)/adenine(1519)-N(6))-dimethyltransferase RsmA, partial [Candidatus Micrarchaeota archaeon]